MSLTPSAPVQRVLDALGQKGRRWAAKGSSWAAQCPAHEDGRASLSIGQGREGRALLRCHAGCTTPDIVRALDLAAGDLFADSGSDLSIHVHPQGYQIPAGPRYLTNGANALAEPTRAAAIPAAEPAPPVAPPTRPVIAATYDYVDDGGHLVLQAVRYEPKDFRQRRPDGSGGWIWSVSGIEHPPIYRLPEVIEAAATDRLIFIVEGEKDADTLAELGYCATTNIGGAKKWSEHYSQWLHGATVAILPDNDQVGQDHAELVATSLTAAGCVVRVVPLPGLPAKGDVSDWLDAGHTLDELDAVVAGTPRWRPADEREQAKTRWRLDEILEDEEMMRPPACVVPRFVWESRSTLLASAEKAGKSTLCGAMAAAVSRGRPFFDVDEPCQRGDVLIFGLEEFLGDAARRLRHFGADAKRVHLVPALPAEPHARVEALRGHVEAVKPALVIVDTLMAYADGLISDAAASSQMQPVVQGLTRLAHETGCGLLLVHHARKSDGKYRDSSAIGGAVDVIVEVFSPEEHDDPTLRESRARGRVPVQGCRFRYNGGEYHLDLGATATPAERILGYVRANPRCSHSVLRNVAGGRAEAADKIISDLLTGGRLIDEGNDDRHAYRIPLAIGGNHA